MINSRPFSVIGVLADRKRHRKLCHFCRIVCQLYKHFKFQNFDRVLELRRRFTLALAFGALFETSCIVLRLF